MVKQIITKGEIPITKNIRVIDEQGNEHEATYPKRAKGLVKNGRARFVDENTICLACPPDTNLEETKMTNNTEKTVNTTVNTAPTLTAKEIFDQIVALQHELGSLSHLTEAVQTIYSTDAPQTDYNEDSEGENDDTAVFKAKSVELLSDAFTNREETYWKMLKLYEKMYDDITTAKTSKSTKQAILHVMDCGKDEMDEHSMLSAIGAILSSEDAV